MAQVIGNKFKDVPEHGSVVAQISEEEMSNFKDIDRYYTALQHNPHVFTREETINIVQQREAWWMNTCREHEIEYAWPIRLDMITREIYIDSK